MVTVVCVLKRGGAYSTKYVSRLEEAVRVHTTVPYRFLCLTDDDVDCCDVVRLKHNWPGWWSKIELFRDDLESCQSLYFDLDTLVVGNIDALVDVANRVNFAALRGFNTKYGRNVENLASGIMVGNFLLNSQVCTKFLEDPQGHMSESRQNWRHGDQGYLASVLGMDVPRLQNALPDDYIVGKRTARDKSFILPDTRVIAWSGEPRLHRAKDEFIADYWWNSS